MNWGYIQWHMLVRVSHFKETICCRAQRTSAFHRSTWLPSAAAYSYSGRNDSDLTGSSVEQRLVRAVRGIIPKWLYFNYLQVGEWLRFGQNNTIHNIARCCVFVGAHAVRWPCFPCNDSTFERLLFFCQKERNSVKIWVSSVDLEVNTYGLEPFHTWARRWIQSGLPPWGLWQNPTRMVPYRC